jgi:hypothetical protein
MRGNLSIGKSDNVVKFSGPDMSRSESETIEVLAEREELETNILSQDFARLRIDRNRTLMAGLKNRDFVSKCTRSAKAIIALSAGRPYNKDELLTVVTV